MSLETVELKLEDWERLRDPMTLHINLLRGFPCTLSREQLFHLAGYKAAQLAAVADAAADLIHDDRHVGGDVSFKMGGHRRIRLADALKALKE